MTAWAENIVNDALMTRQGYDAQHLPSRISVYPVESRVALFACSARQLLCLRSARHQLELPVVNLLTIILVRDLLLFCNAHTAAVLPNGAAVALDEQIAGIDNARKSLNVWWTRILCLAAETASDLLFVAAYFRIAVVASGAACAGPSASRRLAVGYVCALTASWKLFLARQ
jgi:hypothetical protein